MTDDDLSPATPESPGGTPLSRHTRRWDSEVSSLREWLHRRQGRTYHPRGRLSSLLPVDQCSLTLRSLEDPRFSEREENVIGERIATPLPYYDVAHLEGAKTIRPF